MPIRQINLTKLQSATATMHLGGILGGMAASHDAAPMLTELRLNALPVYRLGLEDVDNNLALEALKISSFFAWRGTADTVELNHDGDVVAMLDSNIAAQLSTALRKLDTAPDANESSARLLLAPALHVQAIWVHKNGKDDAFVPFGMVFPPLSVGKSYDREAFLNALGTLAKSCRTR